MVAEWGILIKEIGSARPPPVATRQQHTGAGSPALPVESTRLWSTVCRCQSAV